MTEIAKSLGISFSPHKSEMINRIKEVEIMESGGGVLRLLSTVMRVWIGSSCGLGSKEGLSGALIFH